MSAQDLVFALLAVGTGLSAVMVVTSRNLVHAALFLAMSLSGIGGVFLVMHADFLALVQILVYVGAIAVLFLFGLMLTRAPIGREALDSQNRGLGAAVSIAMFGVLATLIVQAFRDVAGAATAIAGPSIAELGNALFSTWVFPFEVASMLLLAALVGAIVLARRETGESGHEAAPTRVALSERPSIDGEGEAAPPDERATVGAGGDR